MKTIVIDARMVTNAGHGIGSYTEELARGLSQIQPQSAKQKFHFHFLIHQDLERKSIITDFSHSVCEANFLSPKAWTEIPRLLKHLNADLYHNPSFESFPYLPCKYAVTIHDLNHLYFGNFAQKLYYKVLLKNHLMLSKEIICVSDSMRNDIAKWMGLPPTRFSVVPNAVHIQPQPEDVVKPVLQKHNLNFKKYFLAVGTSKKHKNMAFLIQLHQQTKDLLPLAVTLANKDFPASATSANTVALNHLEQQELYALMQGARLVLFPSLYEGYGRPPLEALQLGTPVAVHDLPVLREVIGDLENKNPNQILQNTTFCRINNEIDWANGMQRYSELDGVVDSTVPPITPAWTSEQIAELQFRIYERALQVS